MKEIKNLNEIKVGKMYKTYWEGIEEIIVVNSINELNDKVYLNNKSRVDLFDMEIYELDDKDRVDYCNNKCVGLVYCGGYQEDGGCCDFAPSIKIIKQEINSLFKFI
jgi:hypothetical protein